MLFAWRYTPGYADEAHWQERTPGQGHQWAACRPATKVGNRSRRGACRERPNELGRYPRGRASVASLDLIAAASSSAFRPACRFKPLAFDGKQIFQDSSLRIIACRLQLLPKALNVSFGYELFRAHLTSRAIGPESHRQPNSIIDCISVARQFRLNRSTRTTFVAPAVRGRLLALSYFCRAYRRGQNAVFNQVLDDRLPTTVRRR